MKFATFALAGCLLAACRAQAADSCLVGTWKAQGDGAAAWMARHMHGMHLDMGMREGMLQLKADGTYTSGVRLHARARLDNGDSAATHGPMSTASRGRWRTQGDRLLLAPQSRQVHGSIDFVSRTGRRATRPVPPVAGGGTMQMTYTCRNDEMVTRKTLPGIADPMTQRYVRVR